MLRKSILLVAPLDFTVSLCCKWLIIKFIEKGFEVHVLAPRSQQHIYSENIRSYGATYHPVKMNRHFNIYDDFKYLFAIFSKLISLRSSLCFCVCTKPNIYGPIAANIVGTPSCISIWGRGTLFLDSKNKIRHAYRFLGNILYRLAFNLSSFAWLTNPNDYDYFLKEGIANESKSLLTKNYVDEDIYKITPTLKDRGRKFKEKLGLKNEDFVVVLVGRMIWPKGIQQFYDSAVKCYDFNEKIKFLLVGALEFTSPDAVASEVILDMEKLPNFSWLGFRENILDIYACSNIAVLPSYYREGGYPRALTEPMSMQIPVIGLNTEDCRGPISHNFNGYLVEKGDSEALASYIIELYEDRAKLKKMGYNARATIEESFSEKKIVNPVVERAIDCI
ncbi:putative alpha-galactosyltransferase [Synechococcus sp. PROS-7-1]|uniref:glycosyltransferase n=1 Tax=Synechococcus sp. PROS-7-1 TaxID=1442556 RepID=UPI001647B441|nr:glycosyltransferase [Synechococcus sp. PROS-7-1]QNI84122.1 putative alpha-galactosyltransferase [Synechococcus sp. PROS-7-1]